MAIVQFWNFGASLSAISLTHGIHMDSFCWGIGGPAIRRSGLARIGFPIAKRTATWREMCDERQVSIRVCLKMGFSLYMSKKFGISAKWPSNYRESNHYSILQAEAIRFWDLIFKRQVALWIGARHTTLTFSYIHWSVFLLNHVFSLFCLHASSLFHYSFDAPG